MSDLQPNGDAEVEAFIHAHIERMNTNDASVIAPDFTDDTHIVDAFYPFIWEGPSAVQKWWDDLRAAITPFGLNKAEITLGDFQRVFVVEDRALVAVFASAIVSGPEFAVQPKGTITIILQQVAGAWKISSWNWGGPPAEPVAV